MSACGGRDVPGQDTSRVQQSSFVARCISPLNTLYSEKQRIPVERYSPVTDSLIEVETMRDDLHALPIVERIQLVEDLWDSIASDQGVLPLTDAQRVELDRRLEANGPEGGKGRKADEVIQDIRKRL